MSQVSEQIAQVPEVKEEKDVKPEQAEAPDGQETETEKSGGKEQETEEQRAERLAKQQEVDSRSVYVGNVDFKTTPEQLETFFNAAGVIERITILFDKYTGLPKGYAYVEFDSKDAAQKAIDELNGKEFRNRELRVTTKRTNLPRMSSKPRGRGGFRGRGRGGFRGRGRGSFRGRGRGRGGFRGRSNEDAEPAESGDAPSTNGTVEGEA